MAILAVFFVLEKQLLTSNRFRGSVGNQVVFLGVGGIFYILFGWESLL